MTRFLAIGLLLLLQSSFTYGQTFTVTLAPNPPEGGTLAGAGTFDAGSTVNVSAVASEGFTFASWTENSSVVSTSASFSFELTADRTLTANFTQLTYLVTASASPAAGGSVSGAGNFTFNTSVTLTATANQGYSFTSWTENSVVVSADPSYSFNVTSARELTANFTLNNYTVVTSVSPAGAGSATGDGTYAYNSPVTVTAAPSSGYRFVSWTEGAAIVSSNAGYTFSLSGNRTLVANFIKTYSVTASSLPAEGGTTSGSSIYDEGASATVIANPSSGYRFSGWTEGGSTVSTSASYVFTVMADRSLAAVFIKTFSISSSPSPAGGGTITGNGTYDSGAPVTLTASPSAGFAFVNWTEDGTTVSANSSYSFTALSSRTLVANFVLTPSIIVTADPSAGGSVTGGGTYTAGAQVTVNASPSSGYRFVNWTENGTVVSVNAAYAFTASVDRNLTANFIRQFTITTSVSPAEGGSASGGGTYDSGTSVTVAATPSAGFRFVNWTENGTQVSANTSYTFSVSSARALVANFVRTYTITLSALPAEGGSTSGAGTYDSGSTVTVIATPAAGYRFYSWSEGGTAVSANASYSFTAAASRTLVANFVRTVTITASANPVSGGAVSGAGTYDVGTSVNMTASPTAGCRFVSWTEGGSIVSSNATYSFTANTARTLVANFLLTPAVTVSANPAGGGSVSGGGIFDSGTSVTVSAVPTAGFRFVNWTENGTQVSAIASYTFTITSSRTLAANFVQTFAVTLSASPVAGGTVSGAGTFDSGSSVTVSATPASGYRFANWTENGSPVSTNASYTFTVTAGRVLVASFVQTYAVALSASPVSGGTVSGGGIFDSGASVTVTAVPAAGYRFVNWNEGGSPVSTNASYTFTLSSARTLVANFVAGYTVTLSLNPSAGGSASGGGTYDSGTSLTVTATPASGYRFGSWTEGGTTVSTSAGFTFTVTANRTLTANFILTPSITTSSNPVAGGSTAGGGIFDSGASVTVTATPSASYRFVNWTENGSQVSVNTSYTFTATASRALVANFGTTLTVSVSASPSAGGTVSGGGTFDSGTSVTVAAVAASGYRFVSWTEGGSAVSTSSSYTFTLSANRTLVAGFVRIYTITAAASPSSGGSASGGGVYDSGEAVTLTATPAAGYRFSSWTEEGSVVSTSPSYSFTASAALSLTANFIRICTISVSANPAAGGTVSGGGTFDSGTIVTVIAAPQAGCRFTGWTEGGNPVSSAGSYSFTATSSRTLTAQFVRVLTLSVSASPSAGGTVSGGGSYDSGTQVTAAATPSAGYSFVSWTEGGSIVSTSPGYVFSITANRNLTANFSRITYSVKTSASPAAWGTASGDGNFYSGTRVTVTATPAIGYAFSEWKENNVIVSTSAIYTFPLNSGRNLVAIFKKVPVVFSFKAADGHAIRNNDTLKAGSAEQGSFPIYVNSNFSWNAAENSVWLSVIKENDTLVRVNYFENISVLEKVAVVSVTNQLNNVFLINICQPGRVSQLRNTRFDDAEMFPNPVSEIGYIRAGKQGFDRISVSVSNIQGHLISVTEYSNVSPGELIALPVAGLPSGQYLVTLGDGVNHKTFRVIKY